MDTTTLRTFIALAQIKNFTKMAQQLFVAQSKWSSASPCSYAAINRST